MKLSETRENSYASFLEGAERVHECLSCLFKASFKEFCKFPFHYKLKTRTFFAWFHPCKSWSLILQMTLINIPWLQNFAPQLQKLAWVSPFHIAPRRSNATLPCRAVLAPTCPHGRKWACWSLDEACRWRRYPWSRQGPRGQGWHPTFTRKNDETFSHLLISISPRSFD